MACSIFRLASLTAARTRSSSISTSWDLTTSGAMRTDRSSWLPPMTTVTMPPPADASTLSSAISCWILSCTFCACFINALMSIDLSAPGPAAPAPRSRRSGLIDVDDLAVEGVQERPHDRRLLRRFPQPLAARPLGAGGGGRGVPLDAGARHGHLDRESTAGDLARHHPKIVEAVPAFDLLLEESVLLVEGDPQRIAGDLDPRRLFQEPAQSAALLMH